MAATPSAGQGRSARTGAAVIFDPDAFFLDLAAQAREEGAPNVWTTTELMARYGIGLSAAKRRVKMALDAGKARPTWKRVEDMHGGTRRVQAYEFG